jgi:hypothetical protein
MNKILPLLSLLVLGACATGAEITQRRENPKGGKAWHINEGLMAEQYKGEATELMTKYCDGKGYKVTNHEVVEASEILRTMREVYIDFDCL